MARLHYAFAAEQPDAPEEIEPLLEDIVARSRAAFPELHVEPDAFVRFLARRVEATGDEVAAALAALPVADLYLACACAAGDPRAMLELEHRHFAAVERVADVMRMPAGTADEIKQILRTRFFVAAGDRPAAIAEFGGRGDLRSWVRVSAVREVLRILKREQRTARLEEAVLDELVPAADAETALMKQRYRAELATALREALAALPVRERVLLRYQIVDGLGITAIGTIYRVHRATAARWLARIREDLVADTKRRLGAKLRLSGDEVRSVLRVVQSQLDLSLVSALDGDEATR